MKIRIPVVILVLPMLLYPFYSSHANGYKILCVKSAKATAMGEAFITQADDPSAITFNPAGLSQLEGNQVNLQGTLCNAYTEHESPSGTKTDNDDQWQLVPAFYATSDIGFTNMGAGFGVSFPNGLSSQWGDDSFARYVTTFSDLMVADFSPAYSIRLNQHLYLGAAIDYYYSKAKMQNMIDMGLLYNAPGAMDAESTLEGSGYAWGYNAGAIFHVNRKHRFAATYRAPYSIDYDGDLSVGPQDYDMDTTIDFPEVVVLGYSFQVTDKWKLEFNADWTHWDTVGNMVIHYDNPNMADTTMQQNFHNTWAYKLGTEYRLSPTWDLRGGYIYNENATSEGTWSPSLPDSDMQFFTGGIGYHHGSFTIDTALQLVFYKERKINNNVSNNEAASSSSIDGSYRTFAPCFSLSATCLF